MKNVKKNMLLAGAAIGVAGLGFISFYSKPVSSPPVVVAVASSKATSGTNSNDWLAKETEVIGAQATSLSKGAIKAGLTAYQKARKEGLDTKEMLTIIDYSKSSGDRRLMVFDMKNQKVLFNTWVAHGKNSGAANATSFSNDAQSLKSSLGVFMTSDVYDGKHGESLRVQGLEPGINDNAMRRDIVFHSAQYVGADVARARGMVGRSWGCMAVDSATIKPLINTIKGKTLVVAYYPDKKWLSHSSFL